MWLRPKMEGFSPFLPHPSWGKNIWGWPPFSGFHLFDGGMSWFFWHILSGGILGSAGLSSCILSPKYLGVQYDSKKIFHKKTPSSSPPSNHQDGVPDHLRLIYLYIYIPQDATVLVVCAPYKRPYTWITGGEIALYKWTLLIAGFLGGHLLVGLVSYSRYNNSSLGEHRVTVAPVAPEIKVWLP